MLSTVYTAALSGIDGFPVTVECNVQKRLTQFEIVGLPDNTIKEAKERINNVILNNRLRLSGSFVTINLAPADRKKEGSSYDLAMLVGMLSASFQIPPAEKLSDMCFIGELSLSGKIHDTHGVLCMCTAAVAAGKTKVFVPVGNAAEASVVDGATVYGVSDILQLIAHLNGEKQIEPVVFNRAAFLSGTDDVDECDFADVKGQKLAKRALEVAAAGGHNILLIGPPGTGKSMLAKSVTSILPRMSLEEAIETTKIHSASGKLPPGISLITKRPFRSPHHTMSAVSLSGGGKVPAPGEVSLAHNGVLFLDELPEFSKSATEILRQPLEDGKITITRVAGTLTYPCSFILIAAMNPCRCGYRGHSTHPCTCTESEVKKYMARISGPLLDRIDIHIEMPSLSYSEISSPSRSESSAVIRERVNAARETARKRYSGERHPVFSNSELTPAQIKKYCTVSQDASELLRIAYTTLSLSARGYDRILRVARTIADLDGSDSINAAHISEAISMRFLDREGY